MKFGATVGIRLLVGRNESAWGATAGLRRDDEESLVHAEIERGKRCEDYVVAVKVRGDDEKEDEGM